MELNGAVGGEKGWCEGLYVIFGDEFGAGGVGAGFVNTCMCFVGDHGGKIGCPAEGTKGVLTRHLEHFVGWVIFETDGTCGIS